MNALIDVLFAGYSYTHKEGLLYDTDRGRTGFDCYQMLYTHTPALFFVDGELREYPAKSVILFTPGQRKYYSSLPDKPYTNDWIRFKTDEEFIEIFPKVNVPFSPADPEFVHELFKLIAWESNAEPSSKKDMNVKSLFRVLMTKLSDEAEETGMSPYHHALKELRRDIMHHPEADWSVDVMADRLKLSRTRFQTLYTETFGNTCTDEVIRSRIRLAQDRLLYSVLSVSEIAEVCGYRSTEHFCRQFKKIVGVTPGQFRKKTL